MDIKEYKCPNCGGAVKFDSGSQKMKCPFCDTEFELEAIEEYQKEISSAAADNYTWGGCAAQAWEGEDFNELNTGSCPSCGAELIGDKNAVAMICPNCGNTQIVLKRLDGMLKPNFLIPFKLKKESAIEALKNFYKGKRLLPDCFKTGNRVSCIQGVYLPFWLYDAKAKAHICFKATRVRRWSDSNFNYTKTDYFSVIRDGSMGFEKVPVDGSERMDDNYMDAIEPFDYKEIKDFHTAFLSGYLAEKYDVDAEQSKGRANKRIKSSIENELRKTVEGYTSVSLESSQVDVQGSQVNYALFPVWILNTKYKNENYLFLMNGQSGQLVGRLPVDKGKAWKYGLLIAGITGTILTAIFQLLKFIL